MAADDALYRRFFEMLPDACFVVDEQARRLLDANDAALALFGWERGATLEAPEPDPRVPIERSRGAFEWGGRALTAVVARDVTAQRRFEQDLRESRALLTSTFEKSPLVMVISSLPERRHLQVNEAYCRFTGYSREEIVGHTSMELGLLDPEQPAQIAAALARDGRLDEREMKLRTRSGEVGWLRLWSRVVKTSNGELLFTTGEDWTARHNAEAARAELHGRLEKIASRLPGVIFEFRRRPDGAGSFPYASPAQLEFYGVRPEDVRDDARLAFARVHPDDLPGLLSSIEQSGRELTTWTNEHRVVSSDGSVRWMRGSATPEREADGSVLWRGFTADITERKANEAALRLSRERFKLAMEATSDALWDWDLVAQHAYWSPSYFTSLGYAPHEFAASFADWERLMHPDDVARGRAAALPAVEGRAERFEFEYRMKAKDGAWRWFLSRGKVIERDAAGRATRLMGTNADVTRRKQLQLNLAQTERLASMGLLAAGVAHEINNPLAYVQANLDSLAGDLPRLVGLVRRAQAALRSKQPAPEPDGFDEVLTNIASALDGAQRIQKISRGLNTFARAEKAEREPIDVNQAIESAATMAHNEVKSRALLVKDLAPLPAVVASEGKLAQVFLNLFVNAAHATPEGDPASNEIRVRSWAEGSSVVVEVSDTGRGIERTVLDRIFEPFFTTKGVGQGSGLGLSISRSIIAELGGTIEVDSEVGKGTRVRVRLQGSPALTPRPSRPTPQPRVEPKTGVARVLVVDDEAPIRRSLQRVLRGHEVVTAASGREAKTLLERDEQFDLILCDLMMPEMTGMELHAWLVETRPTLAGRVVFLSGGAFTPAAAEYLERVDNVRLEKPFGSAQLKALVAERFQALRGGSR